MVVPPPILIATFASLPILLEFGSKIVHIGPHKLKLQVWDTAGQERFKSVTRSYYRGAAGALLVYDISCRESFASLSAWLSDARSLANPDIVIILVGNKLDLNDEREVKEEEASRFALENDLMFLEASALTGENVDEIFLKTARTILTKIETGQIEPERMNSGIQYGNASLRRSRSLQSQSRSGVLTNLTGSLFGGGTGSSGKKCCS